MGYGGASGWSKGVSSEGCRAWNVGFNDEGYEKQ